LCRVFENEWWHFEGNIAPGWRCPKMLKDAQGLLRK
jgi:D-alanyl-D-alanine dipeptidase